MPLQSGTTLGPYSVTAKIGEGGMGEVYRARDTKLDRDVALKVLPQAFTEDPDRLARFEREAKVLASLNHPNIGHIYGLEEAEGQKALVLELVEGPTLADRIAQGPIPVDEALPIAKQIAEALEAAHELGIIHRDLKPANVKVRPDGMVKVLDFGLAKALDQTPTGDPSQSPTLTAAATQMGVIMGTAAYMSPEQAKGRTVDKRGDVWAFGAVLYEMLTGQRAFAGSDVSDVLASVLAREPDWTRLPVSMSPVLGTYIRRCLHKDPKQRVADIQDVRLAMEGAFETRTPQATDFGTQSQPAWRRPLLLAGAATVLGLMVLWGWFRPSPTSEEAAAILRASITGLEVRAALNSGVRMAITRDGSHIAVASFVDGVSKLFVRRSDEVGFRAVEGTEGAEDPYFSPDGEWLVFRQRPLGGAGLGQIRRVRVAGGPVLHVTDGGDPHWGLDDAIVFLRRDGMYRVSPSGGDVVRIIEDRGNRPHLLPDGRAVLFQSSDGEGRTVLLADLESGEVTDLGLPGGNPQYVPTGHLVYGHESQALMAVPFDLEERRVTGEPVTVLPEVLVYDGGATQFAVSEAGTVIYGLPGPSGIREGELVMVDLTGEAKPTPLGEGQYKVPRFSPPSGRWIAYERDNQIWTYDRELGDETQLASDSLFPATWSVDGRYVYFGSNREGSLDVDVFRKSADDSAEIQPLVKRENDQFPLSTFGDGTQVLVAEVTDTGWDLLIATERPDGVMTYSDYLHARWNELMGTISPDGRRVAYVSSELDTPEVYIRSFPSGEQPLKVSEAGGTEPRWAPDGSAIYYLSGNRVMKASVRNEAISEPEFLFQGPWIGANFGGSPVMTNWDVHPDGTSFVFVRNSQLETGSGPPLVPIGMVVNWFEELKRLVPTDQ